MKLVGADLYVWSESRPEPPAQVGPFKLTQISNRGTRIYPPPAPEIALLDWHALRYESSEPVEHGEIDSLLETLGQELVWTKVQKLFRHEDGSDAFSQSY